MRKMKKERKKKQLISEDVRNLRESAREMLKTMETNESQAEKQKKEQYAKENEEV